MQLLKKSGAEASEDDENRSNRSKRVHSDIENFSQECLKIPINPMKMEKSFFDWLKNGLKSDDGYGVTIDDVTYFAKSGGEPFGKSSLTAEITAKTQCYRMSEDYALFTELSNISFPALLLHIKPEKEQLIRMGSVLKPWSNDEHIPVFYDALLKNSYRGFLIKNPAFLLKLYREFLFDNRFPNSTYGLKLKEMLLFFAYCHQKPFLRESVQQAMEQLKSGISLKLASDSEKFTEQEEVTGAFVRAFGICAFDINHGEKILELVKKHGVAALPILKLFFEIAQLYVFQRKESEKNFDERNFFETLNHNIKKLFTLCLGLQQGVSSNEFAVLASALDMKFIRSKALFAATVLPNGRSPVPPEALEKEEHGFTAHFIDGGASLKRSDIVSDVEFETYRKILADTYDPIYQKIKTLLAQELEQDIKNSDIVFLVLRHHGKFVGMEKIKSLDDIGENYYIGGLCIDKVYRKDTKAGKYLEESLKHRFPHSKTFEALLVLGNPSIVRCITHGAWVAYDVSEEGIDDMPFDEFKLRIDKDVRFRSKEGRDPAKLSFLLKERAIPANQALMNNISDNERDFGFDIVFFSKSDFTTQKWKTLCKSFFARNYCLTKVFEETEGNYYIFEKPIH